MTPEAAAVLNEEMELSRFNTLPACRRRLLSMFRWWFSRGRGLEEFFTVWGYCAGLAFRDGLGRGFLGRVSLGLLGLVRRGVSRRVGFDHAGWLDSAMVAWFVTGHESFSRLLFDVASQPVTNDLNAGRIWQARFVLNSVRLRHADLADQLAELELTSGRPLVPLGELPAVHGPCSVAAS